MRLLVVTVLVFSMFRTIESTVKLVDNGYEGVVVVIKDTVKEDLSLIDRIKEEFTDASQLLFKATKNWAYFKNITIVVPKKWKKLQQYDKIPAVNVFSEHIRVDRRNGAKGDAPFVRGNMECGKAGWYMHLTPAFLRMEGETPYGNHENAIVHEWGHLRWGLFDEYPSVAHPNANNPSQKINFYNEGGSWKPVTCSRSTHGRAYRGNCDITKACNLNSIQLPATCKFCPDRAQPGIRSSMMATQWLKTMDSFCEKDANTTDAVVRHDSKAPNLQNRICNGQSAWEVMRKHEDFINGNTSTLSPTTNTTPNFHVVQEIGRIRVLVFDVSGSMSGNKIIKQKQAAWLAIDSLVETGSWLGIVSFSSSASILASLTKIKNRASRKQLKLKVPDRADGGTNIVSGLILAVQDIESSGFSTEGTEIILLSDGQSSSYLHYIQELVSKGITVHTIAITNAADKGMTQLAQETGGSSFIYLETETVSFADVLGQAIATGNSDSDAVEKVFAQSYDIRSGSIARGTFTIDKGLGNKTTLTVLLTTYNTIFVSVNVTGPNNETYYSNATSDMITLEFPESIAVGNYNFEISSSSSTIIPSIVSVTSLPISEDESVIRATSSLSTATLDFQSSEEIKVYTNIEKGGSPVLNANVTAILSADSRFTSIEIPMRDFGTGADVIANDGVYSSYLLKKYFTTESGRYNVKIHIVGDGNAFTYTTDVDIGGNSVPIPGEADEIEFEEVQLDEFQRQSLPGEITVVNYISSPPDSTPPAKITDLRVENIRNNEEFLGERSITYTLSWTAVGDDMDVGQALSYDMRMDRDNRNLLNNFDSSQTIPDSLAAPKQAGEQERVNLTLNLHDCNGTCFLALRARDATGLDSEVSNLINVDINFSYDPEEDFTQTTNTPESSISTDASHAPIDETSTQGLDEKWILMIIGAVIGTLGAAALCAIVMACIVMKRSKSTIRRKNDGRKEVESGHQDKFKRGLDEDNISNTYQEMSAFGKIPRAHLNKEYSMHTDYRY